ncbi:hypothetical protein K438DRAFT_575107 [Mycena galopus ATCC 62051]|nr:hypothetical protein K438DRAFT_575107 [Mycena galopus ATCC 62051]
MSQRIGRYILVFDLLRRFRALRRSAGLEFLLAIMGAVIATVAHLFFSYRILVIRRTVWPLCILITLISMAQLAGGMGSGILSFIQEYKVYDFNADDIIGLHTRTHAVLLYLWLTGAPVADVLIAIAMTTLLLKADMHSATRDVVKDIVHLILETNAFSAAVCPSSRCSSSSASQTRHILGAPCSFFPESTPTRCS